MERKQIIRVTIAGLSIITLIVMLVSMGSLIQNVGAGEIVVIQSPFKGTLSVYTTEGVKLQGWGKVTKYRKASQIDCVFEEDQGRTSESYDPLDLRFNDAGKAKMGASVRWEMPMEKEKVIDLHRKYGSHTAIERDLVLRTLERSAYNTGPLYSSRESYAERRGDLLRSIEDQASLGVYRTRVKTEKVVDALTGEEKTMDVTDPIVDTNAPGGIARQAKSPLDEFGIVLVTGTLTINRIDYDESVQAQINAQQNAIMRVQTAIAEAKEAEQKAITVAEQGKAQAAKAKWDQEVIKATQVTAAEMKRDVAALDKESAAFYKAQQILIGEGDAERKRLVFNADGALQQKLDAWVKSQEFYANAIGKYTGAWVPTVVMGQSTGTAGSGADQLIELFRAKAARDIGLDMSVPGKK